MKLNVRLEPFTSMLGKKGFSSDACAALYDWYEEQQAVNPGLVLSIGEVDRAWGEYTEDGIATHFAEYADIKSEEWQEILYLEGPGRCNTKRRAQHIYELGKYPGTMIKFRHTAGTRYLFGMRKVVA